MMFQFFDRRPKVVPAGLLSEILSRVTDIGRKIHSDGNLSEASLLEHCARLLDKDGEATGLARARHILERYSNLAESEKLDFFTGVVNEFGVDRQHLDAAISDWQNNRSESNGRALHFACEPKSQNLIRRLNQSRIGTLALVNMRADLLAFTRENPSLTDLDRDFSHLFASWFNRGFLQLECIDWDTPAAILEKIIAYEAVHEIRSWKDLRRRVAAPDRRLYAYFHPALGAEPLIFVEVALMGYVPGAIAPILSGRREHLSPENATTAVFYSISNCQAGLKGISFGNFLIKQVVETLRQEFPALDTFVTLSPVPGLKGWALQQLQKPDSFTTEQDRELIQQLDQAQNCGELWNYLKENSESVLALVAKFLVEARSSRGGAADPVSRFHLGNGARLEHIHLQADKSDNGVENAWGCMVNYRYSVSEIERNHEAYVNNDMIIVSPEVKNLLKSG